MTTVPTRVLVALWFVATLAAWLVVGILTQPVTRLAEQTPRCNEITGLVLDGGNVTTTGPVSSARRPVEPIPYRQIGDPTTTEQRCG